MKKKADFANTIIVLTDGTVWTEKEISTEEDRFINIACDTLANLDYIQFRSSPKQISEIVAEFREQLTNRIDYEREEL